MNEEIPFVALVSPVLPSRRWCFQQYRVESLRGLPGSKYPMCHDRKASQLSLSRLYGTASAVEHCVLAGHQLHLSRLVKVYEPEAPRISV